MIVRNSYRLTVGGAVEMELTKGQVCALDAADLALVGQYRWTASHQGNGYYAVTTVYRNGKPRKLYMHRIILSGVKEVDHANQNTLDNRRCNLRPASRAQNNANRKMSRLNTSGYRGVSWSRHHQKWVATTSRNNKTIPLGRFDTAEDAARAYNEKARELFGDFARLNVLPGEESTWH